MAEILSTLASHPELKWVILALAGFFAAVINTLAGGGPLITLGVMVLLGIDAKTANITSTVALFPGQIVTGFAARSHIKPIGGMSVPAWLSITIFGGALGGALIAIIPSPTFRTQVPWLVLFATSIYALRALSDIGVQKRGLLPRIVVAPLLFVLAVYGGYFGGGNSFLILALLSAMGIGTLEAGGIKNIWVALINAAAVVILIGGGEPDLFSGSAIAVGGVIGGVIGGRWLSSIKEQALRLIVIGIGVSLSVWLFIAA
jgi:uncharacterized membrane protein YfcA